MEKGNHIITNLLLSKCLPFVIYSLPNSHRLHLVAQKEALLEEIDMENLDTTKGFVVARFDSYKTGKCFVIRPDICKDENQWHQLPQILLPFTRKTAIEQPENYVTGKTEYLIQARRLIELTKFKEVRKVVLSRYFFRETDNDFSIPYFFEVLSKTYHEAFVYLMYLPGEGVWTGATPETLLRKTPETVETMALAGTQKLLHSLKNISWHSKEIQEQQYVTDFIKDRLLALNISRFQQLKPKTIRAGKLIHIRTTFRITAEETFGKLGLVIKALHPTPAVGGLPKERAYCLIEQTELHRRKFYTGFLGPWNIENQSALFVNLRCAQLSEKGIGLYAGGGLTADSQAEVEWEETQNKLQTLLDVVEKLRNFAT